jgi:hypothetical protein
VRCAIDVSVCTMLPGWLWVQTTMAIRITATLTDLWVHVSSSDLNYCTTPETSEVEKVRFCICEQIASTCKFVYRIMPEKCLGEQPIGCATYPSQGRTG